ncbi:MAG: hypothetical protein L0I56_03145, partial [Lacticaseibacillus paracasei]|nr:hypothetical protein [Lacticaseibacillus paracasei]
GGLPAREMDLLTGVVAMSEAEKSLLVLQKPSPDVKRAKQILLGQFPDLNDRDAFATFIDKVKDWAAANIA